MVNDKNWPELLQSVKNKIQEATENQPETIDVETIDEGRFGIWPWPKTGLTHNKTLNPIIFDKNGQMHQIVRDRIFKIVDTFMQTVKLKDLKLSKTPGISDIVISGSNANYEYGKHSDLDIHIIFAFRADNKENAALRLIFTKSKNQWNTNHPNIHFKGIPVEVYVETLDTPKASGGEYSVKFNRWNKPPVKLPKTKYRDPAVVILINKWADMIDAAIKTGDKEKMKDVIFTIRNARSKVLNAAQAANDEISGKISPEDQAFKFLRNHGYIDKLNKAMDDITAKELSLESVNEGIIPKILRPGAIEYHNKLHPKIFDGTRADKGAKLRPIVREKGLENAKDFCNFIGLPWSRVIDVRLKGSLANYNYTAKSDFDLHVVSEVTATEMELYNTKRIVWKEKYGGGIRIMGFPIEPMVEKPDKIHSSSAIYSILKDEWVDMPVHMKKPDINRSEANRVYKEWRKLIMTAFREYERQPTSKNLQKLREVERKIRGERDRALPGVAGTGDAARDARIKMEFSAKNNAFKRLRNTGIFDRIREIYEQDRIKKLSLEERMSFFQWMWNWIKLN